MKKAIKVVGKILKVYVIIDVICVAFIGVGELFDTYRKHPELSVIDNDSAALDSAIQKIKKYFAG